MSKYFGWKLKYKIEVYSATENPTIKELGLQNNIGFYTGKIWKDVHFKNGYYSEEYLNEVNPDRIFIEPDYVIEMGDFTFRIPILNTKPKIIKKYPIEGEDFQTAHLEINKLDPSQEYINNKINDHFNIDLSNYSGLPEIKQFSKEGLKYVYGLNKDNYTNSVKREANFANNYGFCEELIKASSKLVNDKQINETYNEVRPSRAIDQLYPNSKRNGGILRHILEASDGSKFSFITPDFIGRLNEMENYLGDKNTNFLTVYDKDWKIIRYSNPFNDRDDRKIKEHLNEIGAENVSLMMSYHFPKSAYSDLLSPFKHVYYSIEQEAEVQSIKYKFKDVYGKGRSYQDMFYIYREDETDDSLPNENDYFGRIIVGSEAILSSNPNKISYHNNTFYGKLVENVNGEEIVENSPKLHKTIKQITAFDLENKKAQEEYSKQHPESHIDPGTQGNYYFILNFLSKIGKYDVNEGYDPEPDPDNPYDKDPDGNESAGGNGSFDDSTDKNGIPNNPNSYITLRGAPVNCYYLTADDVVNFGHKLFELPMEENSLLNNFSKMYSNPMDSLISYHTIPVIPQTSGRSYIFYANTALLTQANVINNEFVNVYCGSISVNEYYGNFLDYETKAEIYLPFIGYQQLNIEDIMNETTVEVVYHINVITGALMAYIVCGGDVRYQFSGNCKEDLPLSSTSNNLLAVGLNMVAGAVVGGLSGGVGGSVIGASQGFSPIKEQVQHGSGLSSSGGMMGIMKPFLILTRPRIAAPAKYGSYKGFPLNVKGRIGDYRGFTVVNTNRIKGPMTGKEKEQIEQLLKNGVKL